MQSNQNQDHKPVLLKEVLEYLNPKAGETYLDLTAGYGGHARAILTKTKGAPAVLVDRDKSAVNFLTSLFPSQQVAHSDFLSVSQHLVDTEQKFDLILADLGVSSPHLDMASRGFSFQADGPLDMRMDQTQALTAFNVVNGYNEKQLSKLLSSYGQEKSASKIAKAIVTNRPIKTTNELGSLIATVKGRGHSKVHPATKTFQAIRLEVNDELEQLKVALPLWIDLLKRGGRLAIVSFHSLEDKLVKEAFNEAGGRDYEARLKILTKHPVTASRQELVFNPRARSAKLRAAVKIKIQKEGKLSCQFR